MKESIKTILVTIDFTEKSENAIKLAVNMAQRHLARIIFFHNFSNFFIIDRTGKEMIGKETVQENHSQAEKSLNQIKITLQQRYPEINFSSKIGNDTIVNSINNIIASESVDLVIAGTSGKQGLKELILGSTSYQLLNHLSCSVLLLPEDSHIYNFKKILVPVRVLEKLKEKLSISELIAEKNNGIISLLGISDEKNEEEIKNALHSLADILEQNEHHYIASFTVTNDKAVEISKISKEDQFDLIILNAHDEESWKSFFSENFLKQIINNTSVPLLFYKDEEPVLINPESAGFDITLPSPG